MTANLRSAVPFAALVSAWLAGSAGAQPVTAGIVDGDGRVEVRVAGATTVAVDILAPDGHLVAGGAASNGRFVWNERDRSGRRVADGIYRLRVSARDAAGNPHVEIAEVAVGRRQSEIAARRSIGPISGEGRGSANAGQIARFSGPNQIANSVLIQSADGNIGVNTNATAVLHVNKAKAPTVKGAGTDAAPLLQTSGGKGGSAVAIGQSGGNGAAIALFAGAGGDSVGIGANGSGGSITLQPGGPGVGGVGGANGNVLLAPLAGNVGIGTAAPQRALQIGPDTNALFTVSPSDGSPRAGFIRFGDRTGWKLVIGRSRESSGGPLNSGFTGNLITVEDNGALYQAGGYPLGVTGVQPLCRTLANAITPCGSGAATQRYRSGAAPLQNGMAALQALRPLAFTRADTGEKVIGLAAEQVAAVDPRLVSVNAEGEPESVRYDLLTVVLIDALQTQQQLLLKQQAAIEELDARLRKLERRTVISQR